MKTEFDNREHNEKLMLALGFDADDLDANHNGYLTKKQRKVLNRIRRIWKIMVAMSILVAPIAIILAILDGYRIHDTASSRFGICILIIVVAGGYSYYAYTKIQKFNKDLYKGDVLGISGIVAKYYFVNRGEAAVQISGHTFRTLERQRFFEFTYGESYTIFYTPYSNYVLSAKLSNDHEAIPEIPKILKANPPII